MRALTDYWIRYVHECEIWFSLAVSCWPYFILHPQEYVKSGTGKRLSVDTYVVSFCPYHSL